MRSLWIYTHLSISSEIVLSCGKYEWFNCGEKKNLFSSVCRANDNDNDNWPTENTISLILFLILSQLSVLFSLATLYRIRSLIRGLQEDPLTCVEITHTAIARLDHTQSQKKHFCLSTDYELAKHTKFHIIHHTMIISKRELPVVATFCVTVAKKAKQQTE